MNLTLETVEVPLLCDEGHLPVYATTGAAGADLLADLKKPYTLAPHTTGLIPTGIRAAIPEGYEIQIRPRSGLALKSGVTVLNSPVTIDSDYRGEICVILINHSDKPFVIEPKMRIAQAVLAPVVIARFTRVPSLQSTDRGTGGFGSTGHA